MLEPIDEIIKTKEIRNYKEIQIKEEKLKQFDLLLWDLCKNS